jgi:hypothetical protein
LIENQNSAITFDASKFAFFTKKQGAISSHGKKKYGGPPKFTQYRPGSPRGNFQSQFRGPRYPQRHYPSNMQQPINSPTSSTNFHNSSLNLHNNFPASNNFSTILLQGHLVKFVANPIIVPWIVTIGWTRPIKADIHLHN